MDSNNTNTRSITLGSSTVTLTRAADCWLTTTSTNLTLNAGTSTIICSGSSTIFSGGGLTFYNVSFTSSSPSSLTINGVNTFNNLTFTSPSSTGRRSVSLAANQTVNGTLTLGTANTPIRRVFVSSTDITAPRTLTVATVATLADVDFYGITAAGASGTWSGTRLGNSINNSNITFDAAKNVYWNLVAGGGWSAAAWALSSGGAVSINNFPLAQDTVIIENTGLNTSATITIDTSAWLVGSINASTRSNAMTLATSTNNLSIFGNLTLSSSVTTTGSSTLAFYGASQTITTAGVSLTQTILINVFTGGTITLADNLTTSSGVTLTTGTLNLNDKTLTALAFGGNTPNTRAIAFGTGNITLTGNNGTVWTTSNATNLSITGTPTVNFTYSGSTGTRTINFNGTLGTESNAISLNVTAGSDIVSLGNQFKNIDLTGFSGTLANNAITVYGNYKLSSGMTVTGGALATTFAATSGTQQITSNGKTLDFPITQNGVGGTVQLQDNLTSGSTRTFTLTNGTLNVNSKTLTTGLFSSSNSNARTLNLGTNGKITITGSGATAWNAGTSTNLTELGTGTIDMTSASAKTFAGGSKVYPYTLNQGGAGALTITGSNYFNKLSNTNATASTITFPASTTTYIKDMKISGNAGNLVSFRSSIDGTRYTLSTF